MSRSVPRAVCQLKVGNADLSVQPQSGSILQPKVAVAATLGPGGNDFPNPERVVACLESNMKHTGFQHRRNRVAVDRSNFISVPNVAATATLG